MSAINSAKAATQYQSPVRQKAGAVLVAAERKLLILVLAIGVVGAVYAALRDQAVDWVDFRPNILVSLELILFGICVRKTRHLARTATGLIAVGLFIAFIAFYAILIFTVLPFQNPMVDQQLLAADAVFGFSWVDAVNQLGDYPKIALFLRYVYFSVLPQILAVIFVLSFLNRASDLHRFVAVGFFSMIASAAIWWLIPSVGPAAYGMVSDEVQQKTHLIANADYGQRMWRYATEGNLLINKSILDGVIAFPSMHIVMTCMVIWFARRTWLFGPILAVNIAMPIATVLQGGHHIMDLFGGLLVFCVSVICANWLIPDRRLTENAQS